MHRIGEDKSERLDIVPAQFRVLVTRRPKYACRRCEDGVVQAPAIARLIEGGMTSSVSVMSSPSLDSRDLHTCRDRDDRRSKMASTRASAAASTPASTMTRRSFPISITMRPHAGPVPSIVTLSAAETTARTKLVCCTSGTVGSGRNVRRHVISNERDIPWRLAVDDIARGVSKLSNTIRSFSLSDQRCRRPVSTISSRSI